MWVVILNAKGNEFPRTGITNLPHLFFYTTKEVKIQGRKEQGSGQPRTRKNLQAQKGLRPSGELNDIDALLNQSDCKPPQIHP